jgi:hypothetical protein
MERGGRDQCRLCGAAETRSISRFRQGTECRSTKVIGDKNYGYLMVGLA